MSQRERVRSMVPLETIPLPRPLDRFGTAFPPGLAETYTNAYTVRRGVVLDPLAYPWSAADAAEQADRRGLATSREPLGAWARRVVARAPVADAVLKALGRVGESALAGTPHRVAMRELYGSTCGTCRGPVIVEAYLWERDGTAPAKKAFRCGICARERRALLIEPATAEDEELSQRLDRRGQAFWQFVERFGEDPAAQALAESVAALYTPRNLAALIATLKAIEATSGLDDDGPAQSTRFVSAPAVRSDLAVRSLGEAGDLLLLCMLEVIVSASRLNALAGHGTPLRIENGRARRAHASQWREVNVWLEFERTVRELVAWLSRHTRRAGSRGAARAMPAIDLDPGPADLVLCQAPVEDALGGWATVAKAVLLGLGGARAVDAGEARVVGRERLLRTLRGALIEARRRARPDAPAVVYVPHADAESVAAAALAGAGAGYRLRGITYQPDALTADATGSSAAAICDFDPDVPLLREQGGADASAIEQAMREGVREAITVRGEPISKDRATVAALEALSSRKLLAPLTLAAAGGVSELEIFSDHFKSALADARRSGIVELPLDGGAAEHLRDNMLLTVVQPPDTTPLDDRLEWGIWGVLAASRDVDTRTLLRRAYGLFRDVETPDRELVERCIAGYARQGDDGRWALREEDRLVQRQADQTLLAVLLGDAAHRLGFRVHFGRELERRPLPPSQADRGAVLADLLSGEERRARLIDAIPGGSEPLEYVDCLWYDRGRMVFVWELEWTARLHRSVVALGESIPDADRLFRFVAIADERRALVEFKLRRAPALAGLVRRRGWRFVKWDPLRRWATAPDATLEGLEAVVGLEPAVEQTGRQLAFRW